MRAILVHNPSAGDQSLSPDALIALLRDAGYEPESPSLQQDMSDPSSWDTELIIAAGGDGTLTKVVIEAPAGAKIGVIPLGTANNIANSLGIIGRPSDIIASWSAADTKKINIWRASGPWGVRTFIEGCGFGALTRAAHHMDDHAIKGYSPEHEISMARASLKGALSRSEPVTAKLTLDDRSLEGRFLLLEMLNFGIVGPRLPLAWSADPSDGFLEIGYILEDGYNDFCEWLSDGASPFTEAPVTLLRSRAVTAEWHDARFRIGDDYWPDTGTPEPHARHRTTIYLASSGPRVLVPRSIIKS